MTDLKPTIVIDTREKTPWLIEDYPTVRATLPCGDYGLVGFSDWSCPRFVCERKSLNDLVNSLTWERARFWREIEKLRAFGFAALLIEANLMEVQLGQYQSTANPMAVLASIDALSVRCGVHVYWCGTADGARRQFESLAKQFIGGIVKEHNRLMRACEPLSEAATN